MKRFKGFWCLPDAQDKMIPGIAEFDPSDGITLELIGSFHEEKNLFLHRSLSNNELIYGVNASKRKITLVFCSVSNHEKNYGSKFSITKYKVQFILEGIHLNEVNEKVFFRCNFITDKLNRWFSRNNFNNIYSYNSVNEIDGFSLAYDNSKDGFSYELYFSDSWKLKIVSRSWCQEKDFKGINIHEIYLATISTVRPTSFLEFIEKTERLTLFFELAFTSTVKLENLYLFNSESLEKNNKNNSITIYYKQNLGLREKSPYDRPVFDFNLIEQSIDTILYNWMSVDSKLQPILNYLVKSFQNDNYFDPTNFLTVVNALEGFHRRFRDETRKDLKLRIDFLFEEFKSIRNISKIEFDSFKIAKNRHYYSHFYEKDFQYLYDIQQLYDVTLDLRKLLFCCILRQIGFSDELLNKTTLELL